MICDSKQVHCIAGIFGGMHSGVDEQTTTVFLESAYFDPVSIRKTAKRHNLNTDASFRFERGIDPEIGIMALKRAAILIKNLAGGVISSEIQEFTRPLNDAAQIFLNYEKLENIVGQAIEKEDLNKILVTLDIEINNVSETGIGMTIPRFRVDVTRPADVIEEILRVYGYNNLEEKPLIYQANPPYQWNDSHKLEGAIAQKLTGFGFMETMNNSLTRPNAAANFHQTISIVNPLGKELSIMRQSLTPNALEVIAFNLNRQNKQLKLFEYGNIYGKENNHHIEAKRLNISITGSAFNKHWDLTKTPDAFFYFKGILRDLFQSMGYHDLEFQESTHPHFDVVFELMSRKKSYGYFGLIASDMLEIHSIDQEVYLADLDWDALVKGAFSKELQYQGLPKFPLMRRDFALLIDEEVTFEALKKAVMNSKFGGALAMFGGAAALDPIKPDFVEKMRSSVKEIVSSHDFQEKLQALATGEASDHSELLDRVSAIVEKRLEELTPTMVKEIIQQMIRIHLGWLVVWGGVCGGLIGLIASLFRYA